MGCPLHESLDCQDRDFFPVGYAALLFTTQCKEAIQFIEAQLSLPLKCSDAATLKLFHPAQGAYVGLISYPAAADKSATSAEGKLVFFFCLVLFCFF